MVTPGAGKGKLAARQRPASDFHRAAAVSAAST